MDAPITILRTLHIIFGVLWFGYAALLAWVMIPAANNSDSGLEMLKTFYTKTNFNVWMPVVAIGTTLAGLIMWPMRTDGGMDLLAFGATGDIVMAIGALFGLLAFGHGAGATGRFSDKFAKAAEAYDAAPSDANQQAMMESKDKMVLHGNISVWLTFIALVCMSSARYLG